VVEAYPSALAVTWASARGVELWLSAPVIGSWASARGVELWLSAPVIGSWASARMVEVWLSTLPVTWVSVPGVEP
jgi:hypothetical protein